MAKKRSGTGTKAAKAAKAAKGDGTSTVATNRRARYDYDILDTYEAGIVLLGSEIKSIRAAAATISEGYARFERDELWLYNVHIAPYLPAHEGHELTRPRKLLLHRRELDRLQQALREQPRATVVPLRLFLRGGRAKVDIGLARGRKAYDKRQAIAKREADRAMQRAVRQAQR